MKFRVDASVGNAGGVFDAAYDFGDGKTEAEMSGSPEEIGVAVTRYWLACVSKIVRRCNTALTSFLFG